MRIIIRKLLPSDHNFIFATYLRNRYFDKDNKTTLKRSTWSAMQHKRLETIMAIDSVYVACLDEDKDLILGYSLMDGHAPYTYIKLAWRSPGLNIANKLLKELTNANTTSNSSSTY